MPMRVPAFVSPMYLCDRIRVRHTRLGWVGGDMLHLSPRKEVSTKLMRAGSGSESYQASLRPMRRALRIVRMMVDMMMRFGPGPVEVGESKLG